VVSLFARLERSTYQLSFCFCAGYESEVFSGSIELFVEEVIKRAAWRRQSL
jgi:hypothetical protein